MNTSFNASPLRTTTIATSWTVAALFGWQRHHAAGCHDDPVDHEDRDQAKRRSHRPEHRGAQHAHQVVYRETQAERLSGASLRRLTEHQHQGDRLAAAHAA